MTEIAVGYVSVVPKFGSNFKSQITGELGKAGSDGGRTAGSGFAATFLGVVVGNLATKLVSAISSPIKNAFSGGWKRLMSIEQAETAMSALGLNVEASMSSVDKAVTGTKFAISDAADMAVVLGTSGMEAGDKMTRWLSMTASAAQLTNRDFADMQSVMTDVWQQGRVTGETLNRLPVATSILAESLGVSTDKVRELARQGKISADDFESAMSGRLGGLAKEMGTTFESMAANIQTALNASMANLLAPIKEATKPIMASGLTLLQGFRDNVAKPLGESLGRWLQPQAEALARSMETWPQKISTFATAAQQLLGRVMDGFRGLRELASPIIDGIGEAFTRLTGGPTTGFFETLRAVAIPVLDAVREAVAGFIEGFGGIDSIVETFAGILPLVTGPLGLLKTALLEVFGPGGAGIDFGELGRTVGAALKPIAELVAELATVLTGVLADAFSQLLPIAAQLGGSLLQMAGELAAGLLPVLAQLATALLPVVSDLIAQLAPVVLNVVAALAPLIIQLVDQLAPIFLNIVQTLLPPLVSIIGTLAAAIGPLLAAIMPLITALLELAFAVLTPLIGVITPVVGVLLELADLVLAVVVPAITAFVQILSATLVPVIRGLSPIIQTVFGFIASTIGNVMGVVQGIIRVVTGIIKGDWGQVWSGIKLVFSSIWNQIKNIASTAVNLVKNIFSAGFKLVLSIVTSILTSVISFVASIPGRIMSGLAALASLGAKAAQWVGGFKDRAIAKFLEAVNWVRGIPGRLLSALGNIGNFFKDAGKKLIGGLVSGITGAFGGAVNAVKSGLGKIRNLLPFSPAKEGPFSGKGYTLYSGRALIQDFAKGIEGEQATARNALESVLDVSAASLPGLEPGKAQVVGAGSGGGMVIQGPLVHVAQMIVRTEDDIRRVSQELQRNIDAKARALGAGDLVGSVA